jgi:glutamyl-tRNA synthetase
MDDAALLAEVEGYLAAQHRPLLTNGVRAQMLQIMPELKTRAKTIPQIIDMAAFLLDDRPFLPDAAAAKVMASVPDGMVERLTSRLRDASWTAGDLEAVVRDFAASEGLGLGKVAQPLRVALTGRTISPGVFDMLQVLGREESLARLRECAGAAPAAP